MVKIYIYLCAKILKVHTLAQTHTHQHYLYIVLALPYKLTIWLKIFIKTFRILTRFQSFAHADLQTTQIHTVLAALSAFWCSWLLTTPSAEYWAQDTLWKLWKYLNDGTHIKFQLIHPKTLLRMYSWIPWFVAQWWKAHGVHPFKYHTAPHKWTEKKTRIKSFTHTHYNHGKSELFSTPEKYRNEKEACAKLVLASAKLVYWDCIFMY